MYLALAVTLVLDVIFANPRFCFSVIAPKRIPETCGGEIHLAPDSQWLLLTPRYLAYFDPIVRCEWRLNAPDGYEFLFRTGAAAFYVQEQMKTVVYGYNASVDYLYLSTDRPVPVSLQAKRLSPGTQFTGIKGPNGVLFPRTNKLFATFVTNGDEEVSQGFNITVKAIESSPSAPCGWNVTIIREPVTIHYRKNNTQETLCVWHLFAVRGPQTLLRIQEMVTESQTYNDRRIYTSCEDDYLEIQEQSSEVIESALAYDAGQFLLRHDRICLNSTENNRRIHLHLHHTFLLQSDHIMCTGIQNEIANQLI